QLPVDVVLLDVRQQVHQHPYPLGRVGAGRGGGGEVAAVGIVDVGFGAVVAGGQNPVGSVVVVGGQADLLEIVRAAHSGGGLADLLDGGQQQADQDRDDRDHHQQLDQREPKTGSPGAGASHENTSEKAEGGRNGGGQPDPRTAEPHRVRAGASRRNKTE